MIHLIGTYSCKADAKGRVKVPVGLKNQLDPVAAEGFVLKRSVFQPCLELYPMTKWKEIMHDMTKLNRFVRKNNDFIRRFTAGVRVLEMDSAGRLLIPKDLADFAGISRELVLSSSIDVIEVWDEAKYEEVIDASIDDFAALAEEVMGNVKDNGENGIS
ncbi:MAG TPA: division/cell wall cluster transcriptional repressor MraZ [Flavobacteriaceae bacterium]|nr:division/cell wall cluster transcriptional repressor MraZ [Flavobacteriaceae bacterium]